MRKFISMLVIVLLFTTVIGTTAFAIEDEAAEQPTVTTSTEPVIEESQKTDVPSTQDISDQVNNNTAPATQDEASQVDNDTLSTAKETSETNSENKTAEPATEDVTNTTNVNQEANETTSTTETASYYTVEFVNPTDGTEHVIAGGTDVALSTLNDELKLNLNLADVENVESSDSTLFSVEKVGVIDKSYSYDYIVHSLKAFDSAEQLRIYLANSGLVTVDVYDDNYEDIAKQVWVGYGDNTGTAYREVSFIGQTWYVIGFNGNGTASYVNTMTLLLKDLAVSSTAFNTDNSKANQYLYGTAERQMFNWQHQILKNPEYTGWNSLLTARKISKGTYTEDEPYCDGVEGNETYQSFFLLSSKEAYTQLDNSKMKSAGGQEAYGYASGSWWLRSPGKDSNLAAYYDANDKSSGINGADVSNASTYGLRPATLINLGNLKQNSSMLTFLDTPIESSNLSNSSGSSSSISSACVTLIVYVDDVRLTYGEDYTIENSKIILSVDYLATLDQGIHTLRTSNSFYAKFSVNDNSDANVKYAWTTGMTEGLKF